MSSRTNGCWHFALHCVDIKFSQALKKQAEISLNHVIFPWRQSQNMSTNSSASACHVCFSNASPYEQPKHVICFQRFFRVLLILLHPFHVYLNGNYFLFIYPYKANNNTRVMHSQGYSSTDPQCSLMMSSGCKYAKGEKRNGKSAALTKLLELSMQ